MLRVSQKATSSAKSLPSLARSLSYTPLYDFHIQNEGKMVDYAGYSMPVLYKKQSHTVSHKWVRTNAGLFDVSHMLQHKFKGPDAKALLEQVTPSDLSALKPFTSTLSVLLNANGGIVDDTIITKHAEDEFYVVTNAGCRDKDLAFFTAEAEKHGLKLDRETITGALIALQGPKASETLQKLTSFNLKEIGFGESAFVNVLGADLHVARGGYTGEDGFEISIPDDAKAMEITNAMVASEDVEPIGLAARDSLRLEAGMCLYGHELSEDISVAEARLGWVVGKSRKSGFNGSARVLTDMEEKTPLIRCGLVSSGPAPREHAKVLDTSGAVIGEITSGSLSPTLGKNVAMAYLPRKYMKSGTKIAVDIRGKLREAEVTRLPFVKPNYYRK